MYKGCEQKECKNYAKHNTQIHVIYNNLEQLYSGKKGEKNQ